MKRNSMWLKVGLLSYAMLFLGPNLSAATHDPTLEEQSALRESVQTVLRKVDIADFAAQVSDDEFIVKAYLLVKQRKPDAFEFFQCQYLLKQNQLSRSNLLAMLLAGEGNEVSWEQCQQLLAQDPVTYLKHTAAIRPEVQKLKKASRQEIVLAYQKYHKLHQTATTLQAKSAASGFTVASTDSSGVPFEAYNTYFGYLHAHTSYSDGKGAPAEAYQYARYTGKLDFFAVTDHGEQLIFWPWQKKWNKIKAAADAADAPGAFTALWGFEWTNPLLGHINIINTADFTHCIANAGLGDIYNWLENRPDGFGTFNHPGSFDLLNEEFEYLRQTEPEVIAQMVGIETFNETKGFDKYYYQSTWENSPYSYMDTGNRNGWLLGALGGQDNHDQNWGTLNQFRTAVLAKSLTREGIIEAYRNRRFYATEDSDLYLDFRCSGYPMGAQLTGVTRYFTVTVKDTGNDSFTEARLYRNGELIAAKPLSGSAGTTFFTDYATTVAAYYYVIVKQSDDNDGNGRSDEAISSAIWIR